MIRTEKIHAIAFTVPIAEFHTADSLRRRRGFHQLGPSVLALEYDDAEILRRLRSRPDLAVGEALLTQSLLAGIGNVFKSEICFACNVNPFRTVATLSIGELSCLASADEATAWAQRALGAKNTLRDVDAAVVEVAFASRMAELGEGGEASLPFPPEAGAGPAETTEPPGRAGLMAALLSIGAQI